MVPSRTTATLLLEVLRWTDLRRPRLVLTPPDRAAAEWWIGFDCHHLHDFAPGLRAPHGSPGCPRPRHTDPGPDTTYKTAEYVRGEIASLPVAQIKPRKEPHHER